MRIMIVDDSQDDQNLIAHYLKKEGFHDLITYSSALKAYEFLESCIRNNETDLLPDLMLIDIIIPGMGGIEFCQIVSNKKQLANIPILMITSTQDLALLEKAYRVGAKDFIHKPIKRIELIARVKQATELQKEITHRIQAEEKLLKLARNIQSDLELAKQVQKNILGKPFSDDRLTVHAKYIPSVELSGDLYYWKKIDKDQYGIIICDVRGHGIPGALISMSIHSVLYDLMMKVTDPKEVVKRLNAHMYRIYNEMNEKKYISYYFTAIYLVIDTNERKIKYVNAGHPPAILFHQDKTNSLLMTGCPPIGLLSELQINQGEVFYNKGASLLLYSDGLTELPDNREIDGIDFLTKFVTKIPNKGEQLLDAIIKERMSSSKIMDDICLVTIQLH